MKGETGLPRRSSKSGRPGEAKGTEARDASAGSESNAARLQRLNAVARLMDDAVEVPVLGFRIGLDPLLGLLPGIGDVVGATFSGWMVITAARMGAGPPTIIRMLLNLGLDALLGAVPLLGDLFDVAFKANRRNLRIVQEGMEDPERISRQSRAVVAGAVLGVLGLLAALVGLLGWLTAGLWGLMTG